MLCAGKARRVEWKTRETGFKAHYHFNLKVPKARKFRFKAANLCLAAAGVGVWVQMAPGAMSPIPNFGFVPAKGSLIAVCCNHFIIYGRNGFFWDNLPCVVPSETAGFGMGLLRKGFLPLVSSLCSSSHHAELLRRKLGQFKEI